MNLHEYQAKSLLRDFGIPVLRGFLAYTPREAQKAAVNLGGLCVVKAQVHAGGRGKAGGVKLAKDPVEAYNRASEILGMRLISAQTGPQGCLVRKVWVEQGASIEQEYYLSFVVDRDNSCIKILVSAEGGVEIEEVAAADPEKILEVAISPISGIQAFHSRKVASFLRLEKKQAKEMAELLSKLYFAFCSLDCLMLEINPLIRTADGEFVCLDAKMIIDDDGKFRQRTALEMLDYDEIDERELRASEVGISYVALEGSIGCMVNGAGLAMATMDIIKQAGGSPANFLDVGGGATKEMVTEAFTIILKDPSVRGVLVNIFGGIMRCDVIAEGIVEAAKHLSLSVPVVVRLKGTNVEAGNKILAESGLRLTPVATMDEAASAIVAAVS